MRTIAYNIRTSVLAIAGATLTGLTHAAEDVPVDTSLWDCSLCIYPYGWHGVVDAGPGWVSDESLKFADYRGLDEEGGFGALAGDAHYLEESGRYFDIYARNLGIDSRMVEARGGVRGRYEFRLAYRELPKYRGFGTRTPYLGAGGSRLELPTGWIHAPTTSGMTQLASSLNRVGLGLERRTLEAGLTVRLASRWKWNIDVEHVQKEGVRPFGAGVFTIHSSHFPAPVDFTTDRAALAVSFDGQAGQFTAGLHGSWFDNGVAAITWSNPFEPIPGTEVLRASLEPDNHAYHLRLAGAWTPTRGVRLSGRATAGRMLQDDRFLPYTTNDTVPAEPLPRASLDGRIETAKLDLAGSLRMRLTGRLDLTAKASLDDHDNQTAVDAWRPIITDLVQREATFNRPYSFERRDYSVEARYRARYGTRLRAGIRRRDVERSLQSVAETRETTAWAETGFSPWPTAHFRLRYEMGDRDVSTYEPVLDPGLPENPLMRKFNLADRQRRRAVFEMDLTPVERLTLSLSYYGTDDEYRHSPVGLQFSDEHSLSLDASYAVGRTGALHGFVTRDRIEARIDSNSGTPEGAWRSDTTDRFLTWGIGLKCQPAERLAIRLDYVSSEAEGDIRTATDAGEGPFPTLATDLRNLRLSMDYAVNEHWHFKMHAEHERYDSRDWQVDGLDVDGISAILTMGAVSPDYSVTVLRLMASYRF